MLRRLTRVSIASQVLALQVGLVVVLVAAGAVLGTLAAQRADQRDARDKVLSVAETVARSPTVVAGATSSDPTARLQPLATSITSGVGVDFVVVMSTAGIRYTHPNPAEIGGHFLGHIAPAVHGYPLTETYRGTLGPSVRAVVPVRDDAGKVVALVAVGITEQRISDVVRRQLPVVVGAAAAAFALAVLGSIAVSRRLARQTLGLGPVEITRLYQHHQAVLHAIREGVLVVDADGRLSLANDEAVRLLGLGAGCEGRRVKDLDLPPSLAELLGSGRPARDELHVVGGRVVALNQTPAWQGNRVVGGVTTLRDSTELQALTGELASLRGFADALRAAAHESANRLHTVVTLIELGRPEEAVRFATAELASSQQLTDRVLGAVGEPVLAALLLGKIAEAKERGVDVELTPDSLVGDVPFDPADLVTVVGNLIDNAVDAARDAPPPHRVLVTVATGDAELLIRVADSGPGVDLARLDRIFERGWSTKRSPALHGRGLGLALVRSVVSRHGGEVTVSNDGGAVFVVRLPLTRAVAAWSQ